MLNLKLILLLILLSIPIVKADGCGITCPTSGPNVSFFSRLWCSFFTWAFCNALSWVIFIIIFVVIYFYWANKSSGDQKKIKFYFYIFAVILLMIMFYPSIKALLFTSPFEEVTTTTIPYSACDNPAIGDAGCILDWLSGSPDTITDKHTSSAEWFGIARYPGDPQTVNISLDITSGVNYHLYVKWSCSPSCVVNETNYDCRDITSSSSKFCYNPTDASWRGVASAIYQTGDSSKTYNVSMSNS